MKIKKWLKPPIIISIPVFILNIAYGVFCGTILAKYFNYEILLPKSFLDFSIATIVINAVLIGLLLIYLIAKRKRK